MRKLLIRLAVVAGAWGILSAANAASLSWRFAGLNAVREKKDLVTLREVTGLPEFAGFNSNLVQRVAATLAKQLAEGGGNEADLTKLLQPLASDLVAQQTVYELSQQGNATTWALAIQLPADRHEIWQKNWDQISKAPNAASAKISRDGDWTLLGNGSTKGALDKAKEPAKDVLRVTGDAMLLNKILPRLKANHSDLRVSVQGKSLRAEGKVQFEGDLPFKLSKWIIPTNTIREPLIGFTAIQGVAPLLGRARMFEKHPAPNQLFVWSEGASFFSTYAAAQVDDSRAFMNDFVHGLDPSMLGQRYIGKFEFDTNNFGLYLTGLPIAVPFVRLGHTNDANFIHVGFMPMDRFVSNGIPAELTREISTRTNILYYDWELTGARLTHLRPLSQIVAMATRKNVPMFNTPAQKWLVAVENKIGNTISEVAVTGPREVTFVRRSDLGFSALELFALVQWAAGSQAGPALPKP